jgi:5-formyltetrahydrofolate cyclo-ligase
LRRHFLAKTSAITPLYRHQAGQAAALLLTQHPCFQQSQHIACYLSMQHEFDSSPVIEAIWKAKKNCYVPMIAPEKTLVFSHYRYGDPLHPNPYSILEPITVNQPLAPQDLDLVITPLIAFDRQGRRLGTGGGYYDKTFAFLSNHPDKPLMLGLGYAVQEASALPLDSWDILLKMVVTEKECLLV